MKIRLAICALAFTAALTSVYAYEVKLRTVTPDGSPENYSTVRIFNANDSTAKPKPISGEITDSLGRATIKLPSAGKYRISIEAMGRMNIDTTLTVSDKHPSIDLGSLKMLSNVNQLGEVVVTAQKPFVVKQIDRISYDVQADPESSTANTQDILRKVPLVSVDGDGTITVNGSSSFLIYKNNRPSKMFTNNAKDIFAAIPASTIEKIEVITEPGAKYDAEGTSAILNIVTVKDSALKGITSTVRASVASNSWRPSLQAWTSAQIDKVTFSINVGHNINRSKANNATSENDLTYENGTRDIGSSISRNRGAFTFFGGEMSWEPDTLNLFTLEFNGFDYAGKNWSDDKSLITDANGDIYSSYTSKGYNKFSQLDLSSTASFQHLTHRKDEAYTLSYQLQVTNAKNSLDTDFDNIVGDAFSYTAANIISRPKYIEHTIQADWKRPFGKIHTLEVGAKYINRNNTSRGISSYVGWMSTETNFKHLNDIAAAYAQYTAVINKVSLRAGVRYEYTSMRAKFIDDPSRNFSSSLNDVVPSAGVSWNINDANTLGVSYSSSISRPGIWYLNPQAAYTPTSITKGNPDLTSSRNHQYMLNYTIIKRKFNINANVGYSYDNSGIVETSELIPGTNTILNSYGNVGKSYAFTAGAYASWSIAKKTRLTINCSANYRHYDQNDMTLGRWGGYCSLRIMQTLPYNFSASLSTFSSIWGTYDVYAYTTLPAYAVISPYFNLTWQGLKEKRFSATLGVSNFIGRKEWPRIYHYVNGPKIGTTTYSSPRTCYFSLSVSYRFGSFKGYVKKTGAAIDNSDVVGGKGGGAGAQ